MEQYNPKNPAWYDQMIQAGFENTKISYRSEYLNGNSSELFIEKIRQAQRSLNCLDILDIGCGEGKYGQLLKKAGTNIVGLDLSIQSLNLAKIKHLGLNYVYADSMKLPFKNETFGVVFARLSPHDPVEMFRVLNHQGVALYMGVGEKDSLDLHKAFQRQQQVDKVLNFISSGRNKSDIKAEDWQKAGFSQITSWQYEYNIFFVSQNDLIAYLSKVPIVPEFDPQNQIHIQMLNQYISEHSINKIEEIILHRHRYILEGKKI